MSDEYGHVGPRSQEVAKSLLEIADSLGFDRWQIRTVIGGYVAPVAIVKKYEERLGAKPADAPVQVEPQAEAEKSDFPDEDWKNADIKEWASAHEVDLGDATKKADMLAAIRTADKEE